LRGEKRGDQEGKGVSEFSLELSGGGSRGERSGGEEGETKSSARE